MTPPGHREGGSASAAVANAIGFCALAGVVLAAASVLPHGGVALIAAAPLLGGPSSVPGPRLGPTARPLAALLGAPALLAMPTLMLPDPLVHRGWACGTAAFAAALAVPVLAFFVGVVSGAVALGLAAAAGRLVTRAAPVLRAAALVGSMVLVVAGGVRAARRPAADAWAGALPVAATVDPAAYATPTAAARGCPDAAARLELPQGSRTVLLGCGARGPGVDDPPVGSVDPERVSLSLGDAAGRPLAAAPAHDDRVAVERGAPVELRVDAGHGLVLVAQRGVVRAAIAAGSGRVVEVPLRLVAADIAPPGGALAAAAAGLVVAAACVRRARRERGAAALVERAGEGRVDEAGLVTPCDGGDAFRPPGTALPPGDAVILGRPHGGPFRGGADRGTWVLPGARMVHVEAHRARAAAFDLDAAAAIAVTAAPLVAAALAGLVL